SNGTAVLLFPMRAVAKPSPGRGVNAENRPSRSPTGSPVVSASSESPHPGTAHPMRADRRRERWSGLFEVVAEALRARGVPQLPQRLRLDLADALAGDAELLADLFQRAHLAVVEPEPEAHDRAFAVVQLLERLLDRFREQRAGGGGRGCDRRRVLD